MTQTRDPWAEDLADDTPILDRLIVGLASTPDWNTKPHYLRGVRLELVSWLTEQGWTVEWSDNDRCATVKPPGYVEPVRREWFTGMANSDRLGD